MVYTAQVQPKFLSVLNPDTDNRPQWCFAFPGDEMVFASFLQLDTSLLPIGTTIKIDKIVQKIVACTDVLYASDWSDDFSDDFTGYREFILDSISNQLNLDIPNGNHLVNYQQNRGFKLPAGDFSRMINYYTQIDDLGGGDFCYLYFFLFPILFRWEYWKPLPAADDEFFDTTIPYYDTDTPPNFQNGKNHFWHHYQKPEVISIGTPVITNRADIGIGFPSIIITGTYTGLVSATYDFDRDGDGNLNFYKDGNLLSTIVVAQLYNTRIFTDSGLTFTISEI